MNRMSMTTINVAQAITMVIINTISPLVIAMSFY